MITLQQTQAIFHTANIWAFTADILSPNDPQLYEAIVTLSQHSDRKLATDTVHQLTELMLTHFWTGYDFSEKSFAYMDLSGFDFRKTNFTRASLMWTKLNNANLEWTQFICPLTERMSATWANMSGVYAHSACFAVTNFSNAKIENSKDMTWSLFHGCNLSHASFRGSNLSGTSFYQCDLSYADFTDCNLSSCCFIEGIGTHATFERCEAQGVYFTKMNLEGFSIHSSNASHSTFLHCNLTHAHIQSSSFEAASFSFSSLKEATIAACTISSASFYNSTLTATDFHGSSLTRSTFDSCMGDRVCFFGANMTDASIQSCAFDKAIFISVKWENLRILNATLTEGQFSKNIQATRAEEVLQKKWISTEQLVSFQWRAFFVRDSNLCNANFSESYLYRAFFTGDHVHGMQLDNADFTDALLIQAYIAASAKNASFRWATLTYGRLNQSDFSGSDFSNAVFYMAVLTKTDMTRTNLQNVKPPFFNDRTKWLESAENVSPEVAQRCSTFSDALHKKNNIRST